MFSYWSVHVCLFFSHPNFFLVNRRLLPFAFWRHLELVAACSPIIADHPDNVSVSHSSQMIMTLPSCSVTRDTLGSSNLRSGRYVCAHACLFQRICVNVFIQILYAPKRKWGEKRFFLCADLWYVCKCIHVCTACTELEICMALSVHEPIGMDNVVWSRVWSVLATSQPPPHLPSHNSTATSKAPLTFLLHIHLSIMFTAA